MYNVIKREGLENAVKEEFGKNFTQVSNEKLDAFIRKHIKMGIIASRPEPSDKDFRAGIENPVPSDERIWTAIEILVRGLEKRKILLPSEANAILEMKTKIFPSI